MEGEGWRGVVWSFIASGLTLGQVKPRELREWWLRDRRSEVDSHLSDPLVTNRLLLRELERAATLRIEDDEWPPILSEHGEAVLFDFFFKGVHVEPLRSSSEQVQPPPARPPAADVVAGAFLAAVTDATMRRQPSWVFVLREAGALRLRVHSADTGKLLVLHGGAP